MAEPDKRMMPEAETMDRGVQAVSRTLGRLFVALRILIVAVLVGVLFQGVFYVGEHEEAMVFHFGRLVRRGDDGILRAGQLYWAWPYPIDEVKRIPAQRSITVTSNSFMPRQNPNQLQGAAPAGDPGTGLKPGDDGFVLTGDGNIMHMAWAVTYRVRDAKHYYLNFYQHTDDQPHQNETADSAAKELIRSSLDNVVLREVAGWAVEEVLLKSKMERAPDAPATAPAAIRRTLSAAVQRGLQAALDDFGAGVEIQSVNLLDLQPPASVRQAFSEVNDAAQDYRKSLEEARAYEKRINQQAEGRGAQILGEAESYKARVVASIEADKSYFSKVLEEYKKHPETMLVALYTDTIRDVLKKVKGKYVIHARQDGNQEVRLLIGPEPVKIAAPDHGLGAPDSH